MGTAYSVPRSALCDEILREESETRGISRVSKPFLTSECPQGSKHSMKTTTQNGDCLLCPKERLLRRVDRAGCPHFPGEILREELETRGISRVSKPFLSDTAQFCPTYMSPTI